MSTKQLLASLLAVSFLFNLLTYKAPVKKVNYNKIEDKEITFKYDPNSCKDKDFGKSCFMLHIRNNLMFKLFFHSATIETELGGIYIEHGDKNSKWALNVPTGYKMISCYCSQPECIIKNDNVEQVLDVQKDNKTIRFWTKELDYTEIIDMH